MGDQTPANNQAQRAASLSQAAESLARAAAKLSEAARAMSLVAEALSQGKQANGSGKNDPMGKSAQPDQAKPVPSTDATADEDDGAGLPQPYRLLLDDEADVLLVLCSLIYDLPKVVCYFTCGAQLLKLYKSLIDGVTATNALVAEPYSKLSLDHYYGKFLKEKKSIFLLSEADIPSNSAKEVSDYTVIHVGWPVSRRQYIAQRRIHNASTNIILAYSGDKDLYPSGAAIMSQTIAWPGDTGGFRASVDIFRPLFEERLSEVSFEQKEEMYLDWIHLHSSQGPRSVTSWTPSTLVNRANKFILGPLSYRSPGSLAQRSTLKTPLVELLPEVSTEFITQHMLQPAVDEGLLRVEAEAEVDDTHEPNFNSASRSAEDTRHHIVSEPTFNHSPQHRGGVEGHNIPDHMASAFSSAGEVLNLPSSQMSNSGGKSTNAVPEAPRIPHNFRLEGGQTYFALDEEFDSIPLIQFLASRFNKTILFLEGTMLKRYRNLFRRLMRQQVLMLKPGGDSTTVNEVSYRFMTSPSPAVLLIEHTINELPVMLRQSVVGCWVYWAHDFQIRIAKQFQSQINCHLAALIIPSSRRDKLMVGISGFKEHPQSSLILARNDHSLLESERNDTRSTLLSEKTIVQGLYSTRISSLRGGNLRGGPSALEVVRLANYYAARVLLHGSPEDGSLIFPPIADIPSVTRDLVRIFRLQPGVDAGILHVN